MPKPAGAQVELLENTVAPMPYLVPSVARQFRALRKLVLDQSGIDFLAVCADVMRPSGYTSSKPGVAKRSWHLTGRAWDADQSHPALVIVQEAKNNQIFFRMYLKSNLGKQMRVKDIRGAEVNARLYDFTAAAESLGWQRIPAWKGWSTKGSGYNKLEFWHYQITGDLTWNQAMALTYAPTPGVAVVEPVLGKNDRGPTVKKLQQRLAELGYLPLEEVDGVFGVHTDAAVRAFQAAKGLKVDGLAGKQVWKELNK